MTLFLQLATAILMLIGFDTLASSVDPSSKESKPAGTREKSDANNRDGG